jgi:hypothetical protein
MNTNFDHEYLSVYQESIKFVVWAAEILQTLLIRSPSPDRVHENRGSYVTQNENAD